MLAKRTELSKETGQGGLASLAGGKVDGEDESDENFRRVSGSDEGKIRQRNEAREERRSPRSGAELGVEASAELLELPIEVEDVPEQPAIPEIVRR